MRLQSPLRILVPLLLVACSLEVVAEGLENDQAWQLLESLGCDKGQGYGIGRPMDADAFEQWMDDRDVSGQDSKRRSY
ncbi:MAG: EAL domain-containing protein [Ectothiorhodospiraceae bacterium]|nr:EAL domain-containing protein [Ectothiorhodospiraceae bacterium]MCH8505610.1 hypothetical protein [Ectothiorhodospiraceae bacterium]